ncbi:MAG TPA: hypothetical protein ENK91_03865 [Bacteroidetes bacterium]|nr:hypothetical protein [Bacteroidota bacterium]
MTNLENIEKHSGHIKDLGQKENMSSQLRDIHIDLEDIYEDIKSNKSSNVYRTIFYFLFVASIIIYLYHFIEFGFGFGIIFLVLVVFYFFYYTYNIKKAIRENIKEKFTGKIDPESPEFLKQRINYLLNGIKVTIQRAIETRNFYIAFFPLMSITLIDILKGPFSILGYVATAIVAYLIGGVFWYFYFKNDINDIESDIYELENLKAKISEAIG